MTERIKRMAEGVFSKSVYPEIVRITYDRRDLLLPDSQLTAKRLSDFMLAQTVAIGEDARLVGQIMFDGSVPADVFKRTGHRHFDEISSKFYNKPLDNLCTFEWQHSTMDFSDVIENGIEGKLARIDKSLEAHKNEPDKVEFLIACRRFLEGVLAWEEKCACECRKAAELCVDPTRRAELNKMAENLDRVPRKPARSFYEAVQAVYFCFDFLPDSICTPDRYFYRHYTSDKAAGILTDDDAKELLQEFFTRIQSATDLHSDRFYRGGQSHFCVGGYGPDGEEVTNELTWLILEGLLELPHYIPQVTFRWTKKTPRENLYRVMNLERNDPRKRIAFVSDEPRIRAFVENCGLPYEEAVNYTMVGCNEPALQGGIWLEGCQTNIVRSLTNTFANRRAELENAQSFEEFYEIFKEELFADLNEMIRISDGFNIARSKDIDVMSSVFMKDCIENGVSVTRGGSMAISGLTMIGMVTLLDSLAIINQFVFDEGLVDFPTLLCALEANWEGYDELHTQIEKKGKFFGNSYPETDELGKRFNRDVYAFFIDKRNIFGKRFLLGNLIGYNQHNKFFGDLTAATPDGRYAGEPISFGSGQSNGRDREGLTALLASVAGFDETCIWNGPTVTNVNLDTALVRNDANFEKLVLLIETYFKLGGVHIQFNYVSSDELRAAQKTPKKYSSLRVRVSGFSDYFNNLNCDLQNEIIARTEIKG